MEGLSDEPYYPWESPKNSTKIGQPGQPGQPYNCHQTKESFDSSIKANWKVCQNYRKQANIYVVFHCFPSLGQNKQP